MGVPSPYVTPKFYHISDFIASFATTYCICENPPQIGNIRLVFCKSILKASISMLFSVFFKLSIETPLFLQ